MTPAAPDRGPVIRALNRSLPVVLLLLVAAPVAAQRADFLFSRPNLTVTAYGGWEFAGEGSDVFTFTRTNLTVSEGDFAAPSLGVEAAVRLTERLDAALGYEYAGATVLSEDRRFVTQDDRPIPQATEFDRHRLMASLKAYLLTRGRSISQFAWIPSAWSPYIGAGVGATWYEFVQYGDFVDYETWDIFEDRLQSDGRGYTAHAMAGVDVTLSPRFLLRGEYRHVWGGAALDRRYFEGFDDIDLSGSRLTLGVGVRI